LVWFGFYKKNNQTKLKKTETGSNPPVSVSALLRQNRFKLVWLGFFVLARFFSIWLVFSGFFVWVRFDSIFSKF
jgi:putative methionine-R-sulfoxide reductase with GAF domain